MKKPRPVRHQSKTLPLGKGMATAAYKPESNESETPPPEIVNFKSLQRTISNPRGASSSAIYQLQSSIGNKAVQRLIAQKPAPHAPTIQPKLKVGAPADSFEQEADHLAGKLTDSAASDKTPATVQTKSDPQAGGFVVSDDFAARLGNTADGGSPLPGPTRQRMESHFGADFSGVRLHTGSEAANLSNDINANAFTHGNNVYLNEGKSDLATKENQHLLAHELTHTIQQGAASAGGTPHIQADFKDGFVSETAHLHKLQTSDPTKVYDSRWGWVGPKLVPGGLIKADGADAKENGAWIRAKVGPNVGFIRREKVVFKDFISDANNAIGNINYEDAAFENTGEALGQVGESTDKGSGSTESMNKTVTNGRSVDVDDGATNSHAKQGKMGLDMASGFGDAGSGIFGMIVNAKKIDANKPAWDNFMAGYGFVESLTKSASGTNKIVDAIAKTTGADGAGASDTVGKYFSAVSDGLGAVKGAALGIIGLYKLYKSQSDQKLKDAAQTFKQLTEAAAGAAKVAKSAYDIINNGIPVSVLYTIPALSIGISAINIIIRLYDAITAGKTKEKMGGESDGLRTQVAVGLGVAAPDPEKENPAFDKDRRGTFPAYKTYYRTKKEIRSAIKQVTATAQARLTPIETEPDPSTPRTETKKNALLRRAKKAVVAKIDTTITDGTIKAAIKNKVPDPGNVAEFKQTVAILRLLDTLIDKYEFTDKMSEINQKRQVSGWTDVILELVSIAGDIVTLATGATGIGAAVGQGIKAGAAGYKLAHGGSKFVQKLYRNRGTGDDKKSSKNKHKEYVEHTRFIYAQLAELGPTDVAGAKTIEGYIRATGVNFGLWLAESRQPDKQVEMIVEAMKQR